MRLERAEYRKKRQGRPKGLPAFEWPPSRLRVLKAVRKLADKFERDTLREGSSIGEIAKMLHAPTVAEARGVLEDMVLEGLGDIVPQRGTRWAYIIDAAQLDAAIDDLSAASGELATNGEWNGENVAHDDAETLVE